VIFTSAAPYHVPVFLHTIVDYHFGVMIDLYRVPVSLQTTVNKLFI